MLCMHTATHTTIFRHMYPQSKTHAYRNTDTETHTDTHTHTYICMWSNFTSDPKGHSVTSGRARGGRRGQRSEGGEKRETGGFKK